MGWLGAIKIYTGAGYRGSACKEEENRFLGSILYVNLTFVLNTTLKWSCTGTKSSENLFVFILIHLLATLELLEYPVASAISHSPGITFPSGGSFLGFLGKQDCKTGLILLYLQLCLPNTIRANISHILN